MMKIAAHASSSAPRPSRRIIPDIASPMAQPNTSRFAKKAMSGMPSEKIENRNSRYANTHAPPTPISARATLIASWPAMYSGKVSGETNRLPRLRA